MTAVLDADCRCGWRLSAVRVCQGCASSEAPSPRSLPLSAPAALKVLKNEHIILPGRALRPRTPLVRVLLILHGESALVPEPRPAAPWRS